MSNTEEQNIVVKSDPYLQALDLDYKKVAMLPYSSNRSRKFAMIKNNLFAAKGQVKAGFQYGFAVGAASGVILGGYSAYKARSVMVLVGSACVSGCFFGTLVSVGSVIGALM